MIISAILGSCSDQIQPIVSSADTARQAWDLLNSSYASGSRSRIISLKSRLAKNPRGSRSITEFLNDMKSIFDELALTQSPIPEEDLVVHVMNQLGDDYANLVAAFKTRDTTIAFTDLFEKLLDHERTLKESAPEPTISTVNYTHRNNQNRPYNRNSRPSSTSNQPSSNRSSSWSSKPSSSQPNNRTNRSNLFCHYCNIPGHETKECRKLGRFLREHQVTTNTSATTTLTVNHTSPQAGSNSWMWDTGANDHAGNGRNFVHVLSEYGGPDEIVLGDGKSLPITHIGQQILPTNSRPLFLDNILIAPNLRNNLISVAKVCRTNRVSVEFFPSYFLVKDLRTGAHLMRGINVNDVYYGPTTTSHQINTTSTGSLLVWHHILGHPSFQVFKSIMSTLGLKFNKVSLESFHCNSCSSNKSHKIPFGKNSFVANKPLQLLYSDVWGPTQTSIDGFKYYVIFVDYFSKYIWLFPLKRKSDVAIIFPQFKSLVEKYFQTSIISLFTDNGGEYIGLKSFLTTHGISHYTTPPHTPEQNGVAERRHRHVVETGLALLHHAHLPTSFWSHAFQAATYLINRLPTTILNNKSPYEVLFNVAPNLNHLDVSATHGFAHIPPPNYNHDQHLVFSLVTHAQNLHINALTLKQKSYTTQDMLSLFNTFFLVIHQPQNPLTIPTHHS
ncbi:putative RNA-directed DNA polymerase [Helianthus debilis subsp. tardiflorus]